jgi:hypothetical protein
MKLRRGRDKRKININIGSPVRNSYFYRERERKMKAYIVEFVFEYMEIPWTDSNDYGCRYGDCVMKFLVTDETASKAKYQVSYSLLDGTALEGLFTIGDILCIGKVRRTRRKYRYKYTRNRLLEYRYIY